ncbi:hypothetical protein GQ44DRAFT_732403 [Phaeosphaeriaceae sp. PMI808]|nr:hypothetical protein GQ44DRAFT_732403 [Phaeosphaeriaceae sp. PMI808]
MANEQNTYFLKSEEEVSRLSNQHDIIKDGMNGLVLAPINLSKPLRVLDSGTADGTWVCDFAASAAPIGHHIIGTDINGEDFPTDPPPNQTYQVQDINKSWPEDWRESFDFVHQRLTLAAGGSSQEGALRNLATLVKPGGWIQLIEPTNEAPEGSGPAFQNFVTAMQGVFSSMGSSTHVGNEVAGWLKAIGFEDVQDRLYHIKVGAANPNPKLAKQGVYSTTTSARGAASFGKTLPAGTIPLSPEQLDRMPDELQAELAGRGALYPIRVAWGRKPTA